MHVVTLDMYLWTDVRMFKIYVHSYDSVFMCSQEELLIDLSSNDVSGFVLRGRLLRSVVFHI